MPPESGGIPLNKLSQNDLQQFYGKAPFFNRGYVPI